MNENKKLKLLIVGVFVLMLIFGAIIISLVNNKDIDSPAVDGIGLSPNGRANIIGGTEILEAIGDLDAYDNLGADLYVFAKPAYAKYATDPNPIIGFDASSVQVNGPNISFKGRYGASKNKVEVVVDLLKNKRFKISITDTKTGLNIDDRLPSNSKRNAFIGTLPINYPEYTIDYSYINDKFTITLYDEGPATKESALKTISDQVTDSVLSESEYNIIVPSWVTGGIEE